MSSREIFLQAAKGEKTSHLPVWFMRQAGRYMASYQKIRQKYDFITMCKTPELAFEISMQPVREHNMDAAIMFSDILTPLEPMGVGISFEEGLGPVLDLSGLKDLDSLCNYSSEEELSYVPEIIQMLKREIGDSKAIIGFSGAPYTLAAYLLEGKHRKSFNQVRKAAANTKEYLHRLLEKLTIQMAEYLSSQVIAGADMVQIFDSWAGNLPAYEYDEFVQPYQKKTIELLVQKLETKGVDRSQYLITLFARNYSGSVIKLADTGADILSIDESRDIAAVRKELEGSGAGNISLQGNLSPFALYEKMEDLQKLSLDLIHRLNKKGHIFNLGHGVFPDVDEKKVTDIVAFIHEN